MLTKGGRALAAAGFGVIALGSGGRAAAQHVPGGTVATIEGYAYSPDPLVVYAGDTVTWTNADSDDHDVTSIDGTFASPPLVEGAAWTISLDAPGSFTYICTLHPEMVGSVEVIAHIEEPAAVTAAPATTAPGAPEVAASPVVATPAAVDAAPVPVPGWGLEVDLRLVLGAALAGLAASVAVSRLQTAKR